MGHLQERLLLAAERPDSGAHHRSPKQSQRIRAASCSQSSAPPESKLDPVTVKTSLSTWGKQQAVGTVEPLAVMSQSARVEVASPPCETCVALAP